MNLTKQLARTTACTSVMNRKTSHTLDFCCVSMKYTTIGPMGISGISNLKNLPLLPSFLKKTTKQQKKPCLYLFFCCVQSANSFYGRNWKLYKTVCTLSEKSMSDLDLYLRNKNDKSKNKLTTCWTLLKVLKQIYKSQTEWKAWVQYIGSFVAGLLCLLFQG